MRSALVFRLASRHSKVLDDICPLTRNLWSNTKTMTQTLDVIKVSKPQLILELQCKLFGRYKYLLCVTQNNGGVDDPLC